jgi:hypothetical protein
MAHDGERDERVVGSVFGAVGVEKESHERIRRQGRVHPGPPAHTLVRIGGKPSQRIRREPAVLAGGHANEWV